MCHWCDPDAEMPVYPDTPEGKMFHDGWMYPHGRYGYTPEEKIRKSRASCPWCSRIPMSTRDVTDIS
jgi:hypothetical protein